MKLFVAALFLSLPALAAGPESPGAPTSEEAQNADALAKTQQMLTDPTARAQAVNASPDTKRIDQGVRQSVGDANAEDTYKLASDVFATMVQQSGGDSIRMLEMLQEAQKDPTAFAAKWTPEQRARLKAISDRAPAANGTAPK